MAERKPKSTSKPRKSSKAAAAPSTPSTDANGVVPAEAHEEAAPRGSYALVIVESPAKAKTITKYLGSGYKVEASKGHIRDLPKRAPKGSKQPVPGVDLKKNFEPSYEVAEDRRKQVTDLKRLAKHAKEIWFATDLDREGEAIAWHLAEILEVDPLKAKRVKFDAITRADIQRAFAEPQPIDMKRVDAQQARRILDRIVGYKVSPLLWKKVAGGLSAGRVQSVAMRLVVDRERDIQKFIPSEYWQVEAAMTPDAAQAKPLAADWAKFMAQRDERNKAPTIKAQTHWLAERGGIECELVELKGAKFQIERPAEDSSRGDTLDKQVRDVCEAVGLEGATVEVREDPEGKGPARWVRTVSGTVGLKVRYKVRSIETRRVTSKPRAPFITSTLQSSASYGMGFATDRTMRVAQRLYEGINVPGEGLVGLITYMRTDSTSLSGEALTTVREYIGKKFGAKYLPEKPRFYGSSNKSAQEAHEAIRPTDVNRTPESLRGKLEEEQFKLYQMIWQRFVACQMSDAEYDATTVHLERSDRATGAVFKASGRVQVFDGFTATGVRGEGEDQELPPLKEGEELAPFWIDPEQRFTSPPPRFNEASLVKKLEEEGIGRPSTYASIIRTIEDRGYVEQLSRAFHATDLGMAVCDFLMKGFAESFMDVGYTREVEAELDEIAEGTLPWRTMLKRFYEPFDSVVNHYMEEAVHVKAETKPAPYACPLCGRRTEYRLGKSGRFLSCTGFADKKNQCKYAAPVDKQGRPLLPEKVDLKCPADGEPMILRTGRFGDFLTSVNRETDFILNIDKKGGLKYPSIPPLVTELPCPKCGAPMNLRNGKRGPWLGCSKFPKCRGRESWAKIEDKVREPLEKALKKHEAAQEVFTITTLDGTPVAEGTPIVGLLIPGEEAKLQIHPEAARQMQTAALAG